MPLHPHRRTPRQPRTNPRKVDGRHCGAEMRAGARQGRQNAFPPKALDAESFHKSLPGSLRASRRRGCPLWGGGHLALPRARKGAQDPCTLSTKKGLQALEPTLAGNAPIGAREGKMPISVNLITNRERTDTAGRCAAWAVRRDRGRLRPSRRRRRRGTSAARWPERPSRHTSISSYGRVRDFLTLASLGGPLGAWMGLWREGILPSLARVSALASLRT